MRGNSSGKGEELRKCALGLSLWSLMEGGVKASAEGEAQAASGGLWGRARRGLQQLPR